MKTWFQSGPTKAAPEVEADLDLPGASDTLSNEPNPATPSAPQSSDYEDDDEDLTELPSAAVAAMAAKRKTSKLDPEALGVIRDEVTRERSARKAEAAPIETQIDLGIDDQETSDRASAARARMQGKTDAHEIGDADADLQDALSDEDVAETTVHEPATKRELLPDIEEINSTLAEAPENDDYDDDYEAAPVRHPKARARSGFRLGFGLMLLVAAALVGLYVYAPAFANSVPSMAEPLQGYVTAVNGLRGWLDGSAQDLVDQITRLLGTVN